MLPDIDGYEVCKKIREFSMCPIIFLSAKSDDVDKLFRSWDKEMTMLQNLSVQGNCI